MAGVTLREQYLELAVHPHAAKDARRHIRRVLSRWGCEELLDTAELIVSELVTNAVKAMLEPGAEAEISAGCGKAGTIWMNMYRRGMLIVFEVWDGSRTPPVMRSSAFDEEGGRGLQIVDVLTESWGYHWPRSGGKVLWCTLAAPC